MSESNIVPLEIKTGWCVAIFPHNTSGSYMFWDRVQSGFNGLISINSIFDIEAEAIKKMQEFFTNPYMDCKVFEIEHIFTGMNRDIVINVKINGSIHKM